MLSFVFDWFRALPMQAIIIRHWRHGTGEKEDANTLCLCLCSCLGLRRASKYMPNPCSLRAVSRKGCQDSEMTRANRIKRKWHHRARMSRERNVKEKAFQEMTQTQSAAVTTRWLGFVPRGSLFSLTSLLRNFRRPALLEHR